MLNNPITIYFLIIVAVTTVGTGFVYLRRKFNITKDELDSVKVILDTLNFVSKSYQFEYNDKLTVVIRYCYEALNFVEAYGDINDLDGRKRAIKDETLELCRENNVQVSNETIVIIDEIIDYLIKTFVK